MPEVSTRHLFFLIYQPINKLPFVLGYIYFFENIIQKGTAAYFDLEILFFGSKFFHQISRHRNNFNFCQSSRRRPRCGFSYRKRFGMEYQRIGEGNSWILPAIILAKVGVISGRKATSLPPRSVKE